MRAILKILKARNKQLNMPYMSAFKIRQAVQKMDSGQIIAYPTEAVYGLGCDPLNEEAVLNLLALKNRSVKKGLILIASSLSQLEPYLELTPSIFSQINPTWPGPVTWIIPSQSWVPNWLTGEHNSLAVRVSSHPVVHSLCEANGAPLVSTSANIQGKPPATRSWMVRYSLKHDFFVLSGEVGQSKQVTPIYSALDLEKIR